MQIARVELLDVLEALKPAVATQSPVEELLHIWFDGKRVVAYNDILGIDAPFKSDFKGGVRGALLLGLLSNSRAKEVSLEAGKDGELVVKVSGMKARLALLDYKRSVWAFPDEAGRAFGDSVEALEALPNMLVAVGKDSTIPDQSGVTLLSGENDLILFSTDAKTMSRTRMKIPIKTKLRLGERLVMPGVFCERLVAFKNGVALSVGNDWIAAYDKEKDIRLWSRLISPDKPIEFELVFERQVAKDCRKKAVAIPDRLEAVIERVLVLANKPTDLVRVSLDGNKLRLWAKTDYGELDETVPLDADHPRVDVLTSPANFKRALPLASRFFVTQFCTIFLGDGDFLHVISNSVVRD